MDTQSATASPAGVIARLRALLGGSSEASVTRRLAATIFIIRVFSAALAYFSQMLLAGVVKGLSPWIDANAIVPLYIGCLTLPAFVVANTQDGIARSHDWMRLGLMPQFVVRQSLIIGLTAGAFVLGFNLGAAAAMW